MLAIINKRLRSLVSRKSLVTLLALGAAAQTASSVTLAWDPSPDSGVAGYAVKYGTTRGSYTARLDVGLQTTATVTTLQQGLTYFFVATASGGKA